jgi:hypothetical protein
MQITKLAHFNIEWQVLRVSLDFSTVESTQQAVRRLYEYLDTPLHYYDTTLNKVWRMSVLLNMTQTMLQGLKRKTPTLAFLREVEAREETIRELRERVSEDYKVLKRYQEFRWDERYELESMENYEVSQLQIVLYDVSKKIAQAVKKGLDPDVTQQELQHYIRMLKFTIANKLVTEK